MDIKEIEQLKEKLSKIPHLPLRKGVQPGQILNSRGGTVAKIMLDDWSGVSKEEASLIEELLTEAPTIIERLLAHIESHTVVELTTPPVFRPAKSD
jgi:hypothetical protein